MPRDLTRRVHHNYYGGTVARTARYIANQAVRNPVRAANAVSSVANRAYKAWKGHKANKNKKKAKELPKFQAPADSHSGLATETVRIKLHPKMKIPKKMRAVGRWRYQQDNKLTLTGNAGIQSAALLALPLNVNKFLTSTGGGYNVFQNCVALEQMNPSVGVLGSTALAATATPNGDMIGVKKVLLELELSSWTAAGIYLDIYVCVAKKAGAKDPVNVWNTGYANNAFGTSAAGIPGAGLSAGTLGYPTASFAHTRPSETRTFNDFWKILKVKSIALTGNSTERYNIDITVNRVAKFVDIRQYSADGIQYMPNMSYAVFAVSRGAIVEDITLGSNFATYAQHRYGCIVQEKYVLCGLIGDTTRYDSNLLYSNVSANATLANQKLLNETDIPVTLDTASVP